MALIVSAASGNFNAGATWVGGVVPGVGDEARASTGHIITINVSVTCDTVSHAGTGTFILSNGVTLTADLVSAGTGATTVLVQLTSTNSAFVVGTVNGSTGGNAGITTLANLGSGTLTITGNAIGSSAAATGRNCIQNRSTGKIIMTGNLTGGSGAFTHSVLENTGTGEIDLTGNATSNIATLAPCRNTLTGTFRVLGNLTASNSAPAFEALNIAATNVLRGNFQSSAQGVLPIYAQKVILGSAPALNEFVFSVDGISTTAAFYTADALPGVPAEADVKEGVVYGPASELAGTFAQTVSPAIEDIAKGVWDYALSAITTSDTIGTLLKTNIDATVSSRSTATTSGIAQAVWDEVLTGATHNIPSSAGRRLRILDDERIITDGQVQGAGTNTVTLEPITTLCIGQTVVVTDQTTGNKQVRFILAFDSDTNTAIVDTQWCDIPTVGDEYQLTTVRSPLIARNDYPSGTIGSEIAEMHLLQGLKPGETLTVTPTSRTAGAIAQTIGGDGTNTTTISRD
jgi:hypothetical protein